MTIFIDTHTHLYLEQFDDDRKEVVEEAIQAGVKYMLLPNVDEQTIDPLIRLHQQFPGNCLPMMGLHPTSVRPGFEATLDSMRARFNTLKYYAVGETGIDLYWDSTYYDLQVQSFRTQIGWALELDLPIVIHARKSLPEIMQVLEPFRGKGLRGIMHCFPGDMEQAKWFTDYGLFLGIGGVVTYKNSDMARVVENVPLDHLLLETDAPYLPPVPHRGKRNMPAYIPAIASKIAEIKGITIEDVAAITSRSASQLFNLTPQGS